MKQQESEQTEAVMALSTMTAKAITQQTKACHGAELEQWIARCSQDGRASLQALAVRLQKRLEKERQEASRIAAMWQYEQQARQQGYTAIAGTDEVGRGPLAGPVVAAAVILPEDAQLPGINDSKKLSEQQRELLAVQIKEQALAWAVAEVDEKTIDAINILEASRLAMKLAVEQLAIPADFVLVDGLPNPRIALPNQAIVKGDSKSISVAAAAIVAKVYRDHLMVELDRQYPGYDLAVNKGYPTEKHIQAIQAQGPCAIHRMSFRPLNQLTDQDG